VSSRSNPCKSAACDCSGNLPDVRRGELSTLIEAIEARLE
jgi:hypothetical protein